MAHVATTSDYGIRFCLVDRVLEPRVEHVAAGDDDDRVEHHLVVDLAPREPMCGRPAIESVLPDLPSAGSGSGARPQRDAAAVGS